MKSRKNLFVAALPAIPLALVMGFGVALFSLADDFNVSNEAVYSQTLVIDELSEGGDLSIEFGNSSRALKWVESSSGFSLSHPFTVASTEVAMGMGNGSSADQYIIFDDGVGGGGGGGEGSWAEAQPVGATDQNWRSVAVSGDGQTMLATNNSRLYLSTNGGGSWAEAQPMGDTGAGWSEVDVSDDGQTMIAAVQYGRVYRSTNGGGGWSETQPNGDTTGDWQSVSVSGDGGTMLAVQWDGRVYRSTNSGVSWGEVQPGGNSNYNWIQTAISDDGQTMLALIYYGALWLSTDGGDSWGEEQPSGSGCACSDIAVSGDGQTLLTGYPDDGRLWISTNQGGSWSETRPNGDTGDSWGVASVSGDGQDMTVLTYNKRLYVSDDQGASWTEAQPAGAGDRVWNALDMSGDGGTVLAGIFAGRLYLYSTEEEEGGGGGGKPFGWDDSANAFSSFGTPVSYRIYTAKNPISNCSASTGGAMFMDSDTGIIYMCDTSNARNAWLSVQEFTLFGEETGTCAIGGDPSTSETCTVDWGSSLGSDTATDLGYFIPYPALITGYTFSEDNDACTSGGVDLEIWSTEREDDDNNPNLILELAAGIGGETANAGSLNITLQGEEYIILGIDNNCGQAIDDWNMGITYRYRHI